MRSFLRFYSFFLGRESQGTHGFFDAHLSLFSIPISHQSPADPPLNRFVQHFCGTFVRLGDDTCFWRFWRVNNDVSCDNPNVININKSQINHESCKNPNIHIFSWCFEVARILAQQGLLWDLSTHFFNTWVHIRLGQNIMLHMITCWLIEKGIRQFMDNMITYDNHLLLVWNG